MPLLSTTTSLATRRIIASYAWDWSLIFATLLVYGALNLTQPFERQFYADDQSIQYPFAEHETVPTWLLFTLVLLVPIGTIALMSSYYRKSYREMHIALLAFFLALSITALFTEIGKNAVGRLRPDFLSRCKPGNDTIISPPCTGEPHLLKDGRKSFPSGHASSSFAGFGFLAFYLAGKIVTWDHKGYVWKVFVPLLPLTGALLIAISRVNDYRMDVTVGSFLGLLIAYLSYRYYYHALVSKHCGYPYRDRLHDLGVDLDVEMGAAVAGDAAVAHGEQQPSTPPMVSPSVTPSSDHRILPLERVTVGV